MIRTIGKLLGPKENYVRQDQRTSTTFRAKGQGQQVGPKDKENLVGPKDKDDR
jgi:hypothetical protein